MGKPELGQKLTCTGCAIRFYDLNHTPISCPKCGLVQTAPKPRWSQSHRPASTRWQQKPTAVANDAAPAADDVADIDPDMETIDPPDDDDDDDDGIEVIPAVEEI